MLVIMQIIQMSELIVVDHAIIQVSELYNALPINSYLIMLHKLNSSKLISVYTTSATNTFHISAFIANFHNSFVLFQENMKPGIHGHPKLPGKGERLHIATFGHRENYHKKYRACENLSCINHHWQLKLT